MSGELTFAEILQIGQIASILIGGGIVSFRIGRSTSRVETSMTQQKLEIGTLKDEIKVLSQLVTQVAVQTTRLDMLEKRYEELRHGEGFVFPLSAHLQSFKKLP
jgi:hypothetical protein